MKKTIVSLIIVVMLLELLPVRAFAATAGIKLVDMHYLESDGVKTIDNGITDSYGKTYSNNILRFDTNEGAYITYDLNGAYETFDASIVCSTDTGSDAVMYVGIYADEELVYSLKEYTRQKPAQPIKLNVSGVGKLSIKTTCLVNNYSYLYFVDSTFTKSEEPVSFPKRSLLGDLVIIDQKSSLTLNSLYVDVFGNVHNGITRFDTDYNSYALFNLDKKFEVLSGCIIAGNRTGSEASMNLTFYLDDKEVYSKENMTRDTPQVDFQLDVSNGSVLKIVTSKNKGYSYESNVYIADCVLKAHEHTPGEWTVEKESTCTDKGEKTLRCINCGEIINSEIIQAQGHKPDGKWEVIKEATCKEKGEEVQHCTVCGEIAERRTIDQLPHNPEDKWQISKEATCSEEGKRQKLCTVCGEVAEEEIIEKEAHAFGKWKKVSGSIWNNPIVKERTCTNCGYVERVESNSTAWVKPTVIILVIGLFVGISVARRVLNLR